MLFTTDFNISFTLHPGGWSVCYFINDGKPYEVLITHTFGDPLYDCLASLISLIKGEKQSYFDWHGEPCGDRIQWSEISDQQHLIKLEMIGFTDNFNIENTLETPTFSVVLLKRQFILLFYFEFKKIAELLKNRHFQKGRTGELPHQKFAEFEKSAKSYLQLD